MPSNKSIGQILCDKGYLKPDVAHRHFQNGGDPHAIGHSLVEAGEITDRQLLEVLAEQAGYEAIDLDSFPITAEVLQLLPAEIVNKYKVLPVKTEENKLCVAMANPFDLQALEEIRLLSGMRIKRHYAHPTKLEQAISQYYGSNVARLIEGLTPAESGPAQELDESEFSAAKLHELARTPSLVNLVNLILYEAIDARASDIHIEPFEDELKTRYRIDGVLVERVPTPKHLHAAVVSRIKILAHMDISERFVPQDGHIEFNAPHGKVDIRVSTIPSVFGESVVMRILDRAGSIVSLEELGMENKTLNSFNECLKKAHGIILVAGPTGSGKTTTLYNALKRIFCPELKIITIEDPVEYQLNGIVQMPVNPKRGLTFAKGLRHILRQDPDVVMVGEIRDTETADIAVRSSLTGHLVFSTLHTNDAAGAIVRLIDMGIEPFLLASSLEAILAQRLVRRICPSCREPYDPDPILLANIQEIYNIPEKTVFQHGVGCEECMQTGMKGRIGIFELLRITDAIRTKINQKATKEEILQVTPEDHLFMREDGLRKVLGGHTIIEEILRVTQE